MKGRFFGEHIFVIFETFEQLDAHALKFLKSVC